MVKIVVSFPEYKANLVEFDKKFDMDEVDNDDAADGGDDDEDEDEDDDSDGLNEVLLLFMSLFDCMLVLEYDGEVEAFDAGDTLVEGCLLE